jgi:multicomponent Na+:H+ antiporter subunit B
MILPLDILIFVVLIATAVLSLVVRDLLAAVVLLTAYSLFAAVLFAGMSAVDVALVEAGLGAGLTGVLLIIAILATTRHAERQRRSPRRWLGAVPIVAFVALLLYASSGLPDRGDPQAPGQLGVSQHYLANSLEETQTPNVVTSLLADYRSLDTLGETMVIVTAALSTTLVLLPNRRRRDDTGDRDGDALVPDDDTDDQALSAQGPPDDTDDQALHAPGPEDGTASTDPSTREQR